MTTNTGGPAFPTLEEHGFNQGMPGMTLRDYFAAKAMQGLIIQDKFTVGMDRPHWTRQCADKAYLMADAMLRERG